MDAELQIQIIIIKKLVFRAQSFSLSIYHHPFGMSQFQAKFDRFRSMTDLGLDHQRAIKARCKTAVETLDALARCVPDDKEELREEIEDWVGRFDRAMVSSPSNSESKWLTRLTFSRVRGGRRGWRRNGPTRSGPPR